MAFLEDVAGIEEKLTTNALYTVVYKELLFTAQPGRTPLQAPRHPVAVLESLEELVLKESAAFNFRVSAWWGAPAVLGNTQVRRSPRIQPGEGFRGEGKLTHSKTHPLEDYRRRPSPVALTGPGL